MTDLLRRPTAADRYDRVAQDSAAAVIAGYSTSFGWACRLLREPVRTHVRNVYALVRVADEVVDDPDPAVPPALRAAMLRDLRDEVDRAVATGRSANLVVHAFALTARRYGIGGDLVGPFFDSMAADLTHDTHDQRSLEQYVHGSAEVVGLMCLRIFVRGQALDEERRGRLERGARALGAAFQNINFLRDLADDTTRLGRSYLAASGRLTAREHARWMARIRADLDLAAAAVPLLPADARTAVRSAHALFTALADRLEHVGVEELYRRRVRVPNPRKLALTAGAALRTATELGR